MNQLHTAKREFFNSGNTFSYDFRLSQLKKLKAILKLREKDILTALRIDLKKPGYEAYTSEIGLIYEELNMAIRNLKYWMTDKSVATPIYIQPSRSFIRPVPRGLVLIISPWNYPFLLSLSPLIGAIASGNCVVIKPSNKSIASSKLIRDIINDCFAKEYISVVEGPGSQVVEPLIKANNFDHIFFTGSQNVGKEISKLAAENLTPLTLELGGKSPVIIDKTVDLKDAVKKIIWAKYFNAGQTCISPDYLLIEESLEKEFIDLALKQIKKFYGTNIKTNQDYGRIINVDRFDRLLFLLEDISIIYGGQYDKDNLFISPTLVEADLNKNIMQEEIFGPILPIIKYRTYYDILTILEKNPNPLALYLFSHDKEFQEKIINHIGFGGGCINDTMSHMINLNLPFGGVRHSGIGSYHGYESFKLFSHYKSIVKSSNWFEIKLKYPPYTRFKTILSKFFLK